MEFVAFKDLALGMFPELTDRQLSRFEALEALYADWNAKINVISRKDIGGLYPHHVLHSLAVAAYLKTERPDEWAELTGAATGISILDVGTGGGFPGIPLAILLPGVTFTLCDSVGKKTLVASEVAKALCLENVQVVNARAESLPQTYSYVVSRAVASLDAFYPWVRGKFSRAILYLRGGDIAEETALLMGRFRLRAGSVGTWPVSRWLPDPYFDGKFLVDIRK